MKQLIDRLKKERTLGKKELHSLIKHCDSEILNYINSQAKEVSLANFGNRIYIRGLIEISNFCKNNCLYCGIRKGNAKVERYRLSFDNIMDCCSHGYSLGFRTFVLQGGEDPFFSDSMIEGIVSAIRGRFEDVAITLSLGEKTEEAYKSFFKAGANRYLLRHETYDKEHYYQLHPKQMSFDNRIECLKTLKNIGYQTGTGIMVGSPNQTIEHIVKDILFVEQLQPQMIGIGPFLSHNDTPFANSLSGSMEQTLLLISIFRLMHPKSLIPSTTALATVSPKGRLRGILAGANVVMPNLSPVEDRKKYLLYNNKASFGAESVEGLNNLQQQLNSIGYSISTERGDFSF